MIGCIAAAGGVTVIAHPWSRLSRRVLTRSALAGLRLRGLSGIEVDHQDHPPETRRELAELAEDLELVRTGSSDYHGTGKVDFELGCHTTAEDQFERLIDRARESAQATGHPERVPKLWEP